MKCLNYLKAPFSKCRLSPTSLSMQIAGISIIWTCSNSLWICRSLWAFRRPSHQCGSVYVFGQWSNRPRLPRVRVSCTVEAAGRTYLLHNMKKMQSPAKAVKINCDFDEVVELFEGTIIQLAPSMHLVSDAGCKDFEWLNPRLRASRSAWGPRLRASRSAPS